MQIEAALTAQDIARALVLLAPVRLHFTENDDDTRWVELERPDEAALIPGEGVRIRAAGKLRYTVTHIPLEVTISRVQLLLRPQILGGARSTPRLALGIEIEDLDLRYVPGVVDKMLRDAVDKAITPRATQLEWRFGETLSSYFTMPPRLEPIEGIGLRVAEGRFDVEPNQMRLRIDFAPLEVERSKERPEDD